MTEPAVKLHVLKGPRVPETTGHPFLCEHFRGTLTGSECLRRQTARRTASPVAKDQSGRVPFHLAYCAGGTCAQGAEIAAKFPDWKPEERTAPAPNWMSDLIPRRPLPVEEPEPASVPVTNSKAEEQMAEEGKQACSESGCDRPRKSKGLCDMHYQRARAAAKSGKPHAPRLGAVHAAKPSLTGQDEFDLMIQIRDSFRKLSEPGKLYVLAALTGPR